MRLRGVLSWELRLFCFVCLFVLRNTPAIGKRPAAQLEVWPYELMCSLFCVVVVVSCGGGYAGVYGAARTRELRQPGFLAFPCRAPGGMGVWIALFGRFPLFCEKLRRAIPRQIALQLLLLWQ